MKERGGAGELEGAKLCGSRDDRSEKKKEEGEGRRRREGRGLFFFFSLSLFPASVDAAPRSD